MGNQNTIDWKTVTNDAIYTKVEAAVSEMREMYYVGCGSSQILSYGREVATELCEDLVFCRRFLAIYAKHSAFPEGSTDQDIRNKTIHLFCRQVDRDLENRIQEDREEEENSTEEDY